MSVININQDNFEAAVTQSDKPVLLDFWAPWCGPCRMIAPILDEIAAEQDEVKIGKINVDENQALAMQFSVMSIPLLVLVKNGSVADKLLGVHPKADILRMIKGGTA